MGAWEPQSGSMANAPAVSSYRAGQLTIIATANGTDGLDYKAWFGAGWVPSQSTWFALGTNPVGTPTMLPFPNAGTIDMFTVGPNFTPYLMQYSTTGPSASHGWYAPASLGGTLAAY
jgi:hypothetical protein